MVRTLVLLGLFGCGKGITPGSVKPRAGVGQACKTDADCRTGLGCTNLACQPTGTVALNGACTLSASCGPGLFCSPKQVCADAGAVAAGSPCNLPSDCQKGLVCALEGIFSICQDGGTADIGAACQQSTDCLAGLGCQNNLCAAGVEPLAPVLYKPSCPVDTSPPFKGYFKVPEVGTPLGEFFQLPFPNAARVKPDTTINLEGFPEPASGPGASLIGAYLQVAGNETGGFSTNPVITFRFTAPVDGNSIVYNPGAGQTKTLYFLRLNSDGSWSNFPGVIEYAFDAAAYVCPNSVTVRPATGFPLAPNTQYAVVFTTEVQSTGKVALSADDDLLTVLGTGTPPPAGSQLAQAEQLYAPFATSTTLPDNLLTRIGAMTFFKTEPITEAVSAVARTAKTQTASLTQLVKCAPGVLSPCADPNDPTRGCPGAVDLSYDEYQGTFTVPVLQEGTRPYLASGGDLVYLSNGSDASVPSPASTVKVQSTEDVCFSLAVPTGNSTAGVPTGVSTSGVVMYGHGTGGNYRSAESEASVTGTLADTLVAKGLIVWGWDQIMNGARRSSTEDPDLLYFNVGNPHATRDNGLQAVSDALLSVLTIQALHNPNIYAAATDAASSTTLQSLFSASRPVVYLGHSQGAVNAVPFGAIDDQVVAMALSGVGGGLTQTLLGKTQPVNFPALIAGVLGEIDSTGAPATQTSRFDPVLGLLQMVADRSDGINYAPYYVDKTTRINGAAIGKDVFEIVGIGDSYVPQQTAADLWNAFGAGSSPPAFDSDSSVEAAGQSSYIGFGATNGSARTAPLTPFPSDGLSCNCDETTCGNSSPSGAVPNNFTMAVVQYAPPAGDDGHFVLFDTPAAADQAPDFLANAVSDSCATPPTPPAAVLPAAP